MRAGAPTHSAGQLTRREFGRLLLSAGLSVGTSYTSGSATRLRSATQYLLADMAQTPIPTEAQVRIAALVANAATHLRDVGSANTVFVAHAINVYLAQNPHALDADLERVAARLQSQLEADALKVGSRARTPFDASGQAFLSFAKTKLITAEALCSAAQKWYSVDPSTFSNARPIDVIYAELDAQTLFSASRSAFDQYRRQIIGDAYAKCGAYPSAVDRVFRNAVGGVSVTHRVDQILSAIPGGAMVAPLVNAMRHPERLTITTADIQDAVVKAAQPVVAVVSRGREYLHELASVQGNIIDGAQAIGSTLQREIEAFSGDAQGAVTSLAGVGNLAGAIANLVSPGLGDKLTSYVDAASNFAGTISDLIEVASTINSFSQIADLGTALLSGGMTGGLTGVLGMCGLGQSGDAIALAQIQQQLASIKADIGSLRIEMRERFNELDRKLDSFYAGLSSQLDAIKVAVATTDEHVLSVRASLFDVQAGISQLHAEVRAEFLSGAAGQLESVVADALSGYDVFPALPPAELEHYAKQFHYLAIIKSAQAGISGPAATVYALDAISIDFSGPLSANIDYLAQFMESTMNLPRLGGSAVEPLQNYDVWSMASRALLSMMIENAAWARAEPGAIFYLKDLSATGHRIAAAVAEITRRDGDGTKPGNALSQWLLNRYRACLDRLHAATYIEYGKYKQTIGTFPGVADINIFGDYSQSTTYSPTITTLQPEGARSYAIGNDGDAAKIGPLNVSTPTVPPILRLFAVLKSTPIQFTFGQVQWDDPDPHCTYGHDEDGTTWIYERYAREATFQTYFRVGDYFFVGPFYRSREVPDEEINVFLDPNPYPVPLPPCGNHHGVFHFPTKDRSTDINVWITQNWSGGAGWKVDSFPDGQTYVELPTLDDMRKEIKTLLSAKALEFVGTALPQSLDTGTLSKVGKELDAIVKLMRGYCALGLSESLERDDKLAALLFGSDALPGSAQLVDIIAKMRGSVVSGTYDARVLDTPVIVASRRCDELEARIDAALKRAWENSTTEKLRTVESTLNIIDTYIAARS